MKGKNIPAGAASCAAGGAPKEAAYTEEDLMKMAAEHFLENAAKEDSPLRKFLDIRGISPETQAWFRIGCAAGENDDLAEFFREKGADMRKLAVIGLLWRDERDDFHDRLVNSAVIPLTTADGTILGFRGYALDPDNKGTAGNSGIFLRAGGGALSRSRDSLFGIDRAIAEMPESGELILVDEVRDMIELYQRGIKNVLAHCDGFLKPNQAELLKRHASRIVLAPARIPDVKELAKHEIDPYIARLPEGAGAGNFVRENGSEAFLDLVRDAESATEIVRKEAEARAAALAERKKNTEWEGRPQMESKYVELIFKLAVYGNTLGKRDEWASELTDMIWKLKEMNIRFIRVLQAYAGSRFESWEDTLYTVDYFAGKSEKNPEEFPPFNFHEAASRAYPLGLVLSEDVWSVWYDIYMDDHEKEAAKESFRNRIIELADETEWNSIKKWESIEENGKRRQPISAGKSTGSISFRVNDMQKIAVDARAKERHMTRGEYLLSLVEKDMEEERRELEKE